TLACASDILFRPLFLKNSLRCPQLGTACSGVGPHFRLVGKHGPPGKDLHPWFFPTLANCQLGRTSTPPGLLLKKTLDDPVLQRVETDDDQPPTPPQTACPRFQPLLEGAEFIVDGDAQGLECPPGRVGTRPPRSCGNGRFHDRHQLL